MPSAIGHLATGAALAYSLNTGRRTALYWSLALLLSLLPDIDVVMFGMGIPYAHPLGHRGFFHSLIFAVLAALASVVILRLRGNMPPREWLSLSLALVAVAASHGLLDAMTDGGLGVGLLIPFKNTRYFLPWRPIEVSPLTARHFFGEWGARVLENEFTVLVLPSLILAAACAVFRGLSKEQR